MSFRQLNAFVAGFAASYFSPDADGVVLRAWFPPTAAAFPETREEYTLEIINNVTRGPSKNTVRDLMGNLVETERRYSIHLLLEAEPDGLPWMPIKDKTTFLVGHEFATAVAVRIINFEDVAGRLELEGEEFALT